MRLSLCQTLTVVSSQDLPSTSRVISAFDVQIHSRMTRWRLFFVICQATSSVCIHLSTCEWRVWVITDRVVVYPIPPISFGDVQETTLSHRTFFTTKLIPKLDKLIDDKNMGKMREMTEELVVAVQRRMDHCQTPSHCEHHHGCPFTAHPSNFH